MNDKLQIKLQLFHICRKTLDERISTIEKNLQAIRESRDHETKSSAGDKYETGRAMLQIEEDNYQKQLHQALLLKNQLEQIDPSRCTDRVDRGSLVITDQLHFYVSIGLGEISLEDKRYYCISPAAPIGQRMMNCEAGCQFEFNGRRIEVREIW